MMRVINGDAVGTSAVGATVVFTITCVDGLIESEDICSSVLGAVVGKIGPIARWDDGSLVVRPSCVGRLVGERVGEGIGTRVG